MSENKVSTTNKQEKMIGTYIYKHLKHSLNRRRR